MDGLELVMRNNLMQFGDTYSLQEIGTAMGTSCAVIFANLYFGWHERQVILPKYQGQFHAPMLQPSTLMPLRVHKRFIDDIFGVWVGTKSDFKKYVEDLNNFGILKWKASSLSKSVDFLDMTFSLEKNGRITTRTFQKENNPYLYIPPHSAHAPGVIKGTVFGVVRRYYEQNTYQQDYIFFTNLFFKRLLARGWDAMVIKPIFINAMERLQSENPSYNNHLPLSNIRDQLFIHITYHPCYTPRRIIRQIYEEELQEAILRYIHPFMKFTVCYSNPPNIQSHVANAALFEVEGEEVSKFITGELLR